MASAGLAAAPVSTAWAQSEPASGLGAGDVIMLAALVGTVTFAVISAIALIRTRSRVENENARLVEENRSLRAAADRSESLLNANDERIVVWEARGSTPVVHGQLPSTQGAPNERSAFVAFGAWLDVDSSTRIDRAIDELRGSGHGFALPLKTQAGADLEAFGRTVGGRAVVSFRILAGDRLALTALQIKHKRLGAELDALRGAIDGAHLPAWIRDSEGRLVWVNQAYRDVVDAGDGDPRKALTAELVDESGRAAIAQAHKSSPVFQQRMSVVSAGNRLVFDVTDVLTGSGSAGIAVDATRIETSEAQLKRLVEFHTRTLDQLATAVAIFGADRRLRSYNAAYAALFDLDVQLLESMPDESVILDRLRATRKLPEQADFRSWKHELQSAYQAVEAREYMWHLPEGQSLRVIANPHPDGGVTWIYENVTERLDLETRYNSLIRVQGETLDHLREGVAVFGSDGRMRLTNPAFASVWDLDPEMLAERPHIADVAAACRNLLPDMTELNRLTASIAGVDESRATVAGRMERADGRVIDYATVPLPEGQTMATFVDITDTVQVERALVDRNEALEAADRLKNDFIQHVSYELRSPLTNIIGFTQLLADANIGPLNEKQREYVGYIMTSSGSVLTIVNDILDLATIDAGIMELDLAEIELADAVDAAIEGVRDRIAEKQVRIEKQIAPRTGSLIADEKRLRQILYNLISNAVGFSKDGGTVTISAGRNDGMIELAVEDEGVGIPEDFAGLVFDRFQSRASGSARGGVGLGLAIVKSFVELHGGTVGIERGRGKGTVVKVSLPVQPTPVGIAAE